MSSSGVFVVAAAALALLVFVQVVVRSRRSPLLGPVSFVLLVVLVVAEVVARGVFAELAAIVGMCLALGALVRVIHLTEREDVEAEVAARWHAFEHAFRHHVAALRGEDERRS